MKWRAARCLCLGGGIFYHSTIPPSIDARFREAHAAVDRAPASRGNPLSLDVHQLTTIPQQRRQWLLAGDIWPKPDEDTNWQLLLEYFVGKLDVATPLCQPSCRRPLRAALQQHAPEPFVLKSVRVKLCYEFTRRGTPAPP
ncbi:hypothetical protein K458DRAFT_384954 [Lentithecium fluviatile CBS 122367]|uniref:Uncharacterized protein n=1 Tax=Lentithecium fluviatile CBS 122367 TaxID=1168545 RepID=A0A6G1JF32_9PLEO|nr:hypothetical protein K458DRAFT_384954 [Lentithecium fluviatile CBS 122367]